MNSVKDEIAKNLLFYRKKMNFTQKELAQKLGVKHNSISSWENGTNSVDVETLFKICKILGVSINDMYGKFAVINSEFYTAYEKAVISAYRNQPEMQPAVDKLLGLEHEKMHKPINNDVEIASELSAIAENDMKEMIKSNKCKTNSTG